MIDPRLDGVDSQRASVDTLNTRASSVLPSAQPNFGETDSVVANLTREEASDLYKTTEVGEHNINVMDNQPLPPAKATRLNDELEVERTREMMRVHEEEQMAKRKKAKRKKALLGILLLFVLAAVSLTIFFTVSSDDGNDEDSDAQTPTLPPFEPPASSFTKINDPFVLSQICAVQSKLKAVNFEEKIGSNGFQVCISENVVARCEEVNNASFVFSLVDDLDCNCGCEFGSLVLMNETQVEESSKTQCPLESECSNFVASLEFEVKNADETFNLDLDEVENVVLDFLGTCVTEEEVFSFISEEGFFFSCSEKNHFGVHQYPAFTDDDLDDLCRLADTNFTTCREVLPGDRREISCANQELTISSTCSNDCGDDRIVFGSNCDDVAEFEIDDVDLTILGFEKCLQSDIQTIICDIDSKFSCNVGDGRELSFTSVDDDQQCTQLL